MNRSALLIVLLALVGCDQHKKDHDPAAVATAPTTNGATTAVPTPATAPSTSSRTAATPSCTAPEVVVYLEAFKPICGRPCKVHPDCPSGQACNTTAHK